MELLCGLTILLVWFFNKLISAMLAASKPPATLGQIVLTFRKVRRPLEADFGTGERQCAKLLAAIIALNKEAMYLQERGRGTSDSLSRTIDQSKNLCRQIITTAERARWLAGTLR